jgi:hypothetical protein
MPQHINEIFSPSQAVSASKTTGSRHLFRTRQRGRLRRLIDGVAGQLTVILGPAPAGGRAQISTGFDLSLWFNPTWRRNIWLPNGQAMRLGHGDTVVLVKGPDEHWFTIGSSHN